MSIPLRNGAFISLLTLMLFQLLKGVSLQPNAYPLISYIFTYADGAVRRSLFSSVLSLFGITSIDSVAVWVGWLHVAMLAVLLFLLLSYYRTIHASGDLRRKGLFWLMAASSIIPILATLNGFFDIVMGCGMVGVWMLLARGRVLIAAGLILLMGLQHEMALLYGVCLMAAQYVLVREQRQKLLVGILFVVTVGFAGLYLSGVHRPILEPIGIERCASMRPDAYPHVEMIWDANCARNAKATLSSDLMPWRLMLLPFVLMACGFFSLVVATAALIQARRGHKGLESLVLLLLMAMPYGLVVLALDVDRIIVMAVLVNWLILDRWLALQPQESPRNKRAFRGVIAFLVLLQLPLNYPSVDAYGQQRLLPPDAADQYLVSSRLWVVPYMEHYNLKLPFNLKWESCIDLRCNR